MAGFSSLPSCTRKLRLGDAEFVPGSPPVTSLEQAAATAMDGASQAVVIPQETHEASVGRAPTGCKLCCGTASTASSATMEASQLPSDDALSELASTGEDGTGGESINIPITY